MTAIGTHLPPNAAQPSPERRVIRLPPDLRLAAARRLVAGQGAARDRAAERLLAAAPQHGIDFELAWALVDDPGPHHPRVLRQLCLAVPGSGRTTMLFLSRPGPSYLGEAEAQQQELALTIRACLAELPQVVGDRVRLAQALPEPQERWLIGTLEAADCIRIGDLAYLRRPLVLPGEPRPPADPPPLPAGVTVRTVRGVNADREVLIRALDQSYIDTLDCPKLCGLRDTADVLESHAATGAFDPEHWLLVLLNGEPEGCCLLSHVPGQNAVELVYLGLSPVLRGRGIGRPLLAWAIGRARGLRAAEVTCAVDRANAPALRLYRSLGFETFASRIAYVAPVPPA